MEVLKKEQIQAITHEDGNLLVSASAGSGKTFVMISRLIRLISEKKADVSQILAVTFTESAAHDMKEKLKKALIDKVKESRDEYLLDQYKKVALSDISTLHSFCSRLIRIYFYKIGVSHDYLISDAENSKKLKKQAIDKTIRSFYLENDPVFLKIAKRHSYKRSDADFKDKLLSLYEFFNNEASPEKLYDRFIDMYSNDGVIRFENELLGYFKKEMGDLKEKISPLLFSAQNSNKPKLYQFALDLYNDLDVFTNLNDVKDICDFFDYSRPLNVEKKLDELELSVKADLVEIRSVIKKAIPKYIDAIGDRNGYLEKNQTLLEHATYLVKIIKRFSDNYTKIKREENVLDFSDLEHFALKILSDDEILFDVKKKYKYIFVDEYQDINDIQEKIINLISSNNVFMVGDVKQSIYGFRGCRPDYFLDKLNKMSKIEGQTVLLNHSFRCAKNVIDAVNTVFDYCMVKENFGIDYKTTSRLVPGGVYPDDALGRAQLHLIEKRKKEDKIEDPRVYNVLDELTKNEDEISDLAKQISEIIYSELGEDYYDIKEQTYKKIKYSDVAVLTRKKDDEDITALIRGLKMQGIPVVSEAGENVLDYPEVHVLVCLLKVLDCFDDSIPLATVMKSRIGKFTDEDLAKICAFYIEKSSKRLDTFTEAYFFALEDKDCPLYEKLNKFNDYISELRSLSDFIPAHEVLLKAIRDCRIEAFLYSETDGENKVKRLRKFVSYCQSVYPTHTATQLVDGILSSEDGVKFSTAEDNDSVKLMTIHASKGLEFPVVIVCGLEKELGTRHESDELLKDSKDGVAIKYYDSDRRKKSTIQRAVFQKRMRKTVVEEEMRILYVALTRAKYSLHMVARISDLEDIKAGKTLKFTDFLPPQLQGEVFVDKCEQSKVFETVKREILIDGFDPLSVEKMSENFSYVYPFRVDTTLPLKCSVTGVMQNQEDREYFVKDLFLEGESKTDTERGIIAHKILEHFDFSKKDSPNDQISLMIDNGTLTADELKKIDLNKILNVIKSDVFSFKEGTKLYREKSFVISIPAKMLYNLDTDSRILLQGVIDLLAITPDGAFVIDYKYSSLRDESLKEKYKKQLDLYSYAVENTLSIKVVKKAIVSLLNGSVILID